MLCVHCAELQTKPKCVIYFCEMQSLTSATPVLYGTIEALRQAMPMQVPSSGLISRLAARGSRPHHSSSPTVARPLHPRRIWATSAASTVPTS